MLSCVRFRGCGTKTVTAGTYTSGPVENTTSASWMILTGGGIVDIEALGIQPVIGR